MGSLPEFSFGGILAVYPSIANGVVARYHPAAMTKPAKKDEPDKFQRYRARRKEQGMKLLRVWVPDPHAQGFRRKARHQAALLRGAPEEREALAFIEAEADWSE
jgi:hypothetical protein